MQVLEPHGELALASDERARSVCGPRGMSIAPSETRQLRAVSRAFRILGTHRRGPGGPTFRFNGNVTRGDEDSERTTQTGEIAVNVCCRFV
jgi:hypothetical protein